MDKYLYGTKTYNLLLDVSYMTGLHKWKGDIENLKKLLLLTALKLSKMIIFNADFLSDMASKISC